MNPHVEKDNNGKAKPKVNAYDAWSRNNSAKNNIIFNM